MTFEKIREIAARISRDGNFCLSSDEFAALIELARPNPLPCDVLIAPRTVFRKGCDLETLLVGITARKKFPDGATHLDMTSTH